VMRRTYRAHHRVERPGFAAVEIREHEWPIQVPQHELMFGAGTANGRHYHFCVWPDHVTVFLDGETAEFGLPREGEEAGRAAAGGGLTAPMPGLVKLVRAAKGDAVRRGDALLVLEAMKMEHTITAPHDGTVAEIVEMGRQVTEGEVLVRLAAPAE